MKIIIPPPSNKLRHLSHEINESHITIRMESKSKKSVCPYCGRKSDKVHSTYTRKLQDLPIQGKKVRLIIGIKKYFCPNDGCGRRTFAEPFDFFEPKATKTKRLQDEILRVSLTQSSLSASEYLRNSVADVGKSTICSLIKKTRGSHG